MDDAPRIRESTPPDLTESIAPGGHRLSEDMPRWVMNDEDLEDLIGFLKGLP